MVVDDKVFLIFRLLMVRFSEVFRDDVVKLEVVLKIVLVKESGWL